MCHPKSFYATRIDPLPWEINDMYVGVCLFFDTIALHRVRFDRGFFVCGEVREKSLSTSGGTLFLLCSVFDALTSML